MREQLFDSEKIERLRRRKRLKRLWAAIILCALLAVGLIWLTGIASGSIARAGDWMETVRLSFSKGPGFPVGVELDDTVQARSLTGAVALLDGKFVYVYSDSGSALRSFQNGYANPYLAAGDERFCIYNQGGKELTIEGRTRTYGTLTTAKAIQFVAMSPNGAFAVVTQSDSYQAQMTVYDDTLDTVFNWYCAEDYPLTGALSPSGKKVAVGCLHAQNGTLNSKLYLVDGRVEDLSVDYADSVILNVAYRSETEILVTYDDALVLYNAADLSQKATYSCNDAVLCVDSTDEGHILVVTGDPSRAASITLTVLSDALEPVRTVSVGENVTQCLIQDGRAFLTAKDRLLSFDLEEEGTDTSFTPDHRPICLLRGHKLLLLTAKEIVQPTLNEQG